VSASIYPSKNLVADFDPGYRNYAPKLKRFQQLISAMVSPEKHRGSILVPLEMGVLVEVYWVV
jgi:hypothetical protein